MRHSLYLHIPFCTHRCAYCDFNTYAGQEGFIFAYVRALSREIEWVGRNAPDDLSLHTIFFGGGTPSLLSPDQFGEILRAVRGSFRLAEEMEVTIEANPGTVTMHSLASLRELGVNRLSLGVQSANGEELRMLERTHTYLEVLNAVSAARSAGIQNVNLDLIYGLPEQTLETWQITVRRILELQPEHVSAYALTLEHGTSFGNWTAHGLMPVPNPDLAADMYEWLQEVLEAAGYLQYEISNWAKAGRACRHNLQYWRGLPYLSMGAGAHGYANGYRYANVLGIATYLDRLNAAQMPLAQGQPQGWVNGLPFPISPAVVNHHRQTAAQDIAEYMIMGLRLVREGVSATTFRRRFGVELWDRFSGEIAELRDLGLLETRAQGYEDPVPADQGADADADLLRLTPRGRLLGNQVFMRFVQ